MRRQPPLRLQSVRGRRPPIIMRISPRGKISAVMQDGSICETCTPLLHKDDGIYESIVAMQFNGQTGRLEKIFVVRNGSRETEIIDISDLGDEYELILPDLSIVNLRKESPALVN